VKLVSARVARRRVARLRTTEAHPMPGSAAVAITLTDAERLALEGLVRAQHTPQALARRARVIRAAAAGATNAAIARQRHSDVERLSCWRTRWATAAGSPAARLAEAPRRGAPARMTPEAVGQILAVACEPPQASDRPLSPWTGREVAAAAVSRGIVATLAPRQAARVRKRGCASHSAVATGRRLPPTTRWWRR